ncbi:MAG: hypothetical protein LQ339_008531 [Xanthoria mediterranea]|nr:MAG: hypothetical protein LQ339_008531 [Xanthoria mediterranea]
MEIVNHIYTAYDSIWESTNSTTSLADQFGSLSGHVLQSAQADPVKYNVTGYLNTLRNSGDASSDVAVDSAFEILLTLVNATLKFFKIEAAKKTTRDPAVGDAKDPYTDLGNALVVYDLVFLYFFLAAGFTLIVLAVLNILNHKGKWVKGGGIGVAVRVFVGAGIALVSLVKTDISSEEVFLYSPWMLPTVMLGLGVVVLLDGVAGWVLPASTTTAVGAGGNVRTDEEEKV